MSVIFNHLARRSTRWTKIPKGNWTPRSEKGTLVGYSDESKGYRIWLPTEAKVDITKNVKFVDQRAKLSPMDAYEKFLPEQNNMNNRDDESEVVHPMSKRKRNPRTVSIRTTWFPYRAKMTSTKRSKRQTTRSNEIEVMANRG